MRLSRPNSLTTLESAAFAPGARDYDYTQLRIATIALWRIVKQRLELSDDELRTAMRQTQNELARKESSLCRCTLCDRPVQVTAIRCLYCGTESPAA